MRARRGEKRNARAADDCFGSPVKRMHFALYLWMHASGSVEVGAGYAVA